MEPPHFYRLALRFYFSFLHLMDLLLFVTFFPFLFSFSFSSYFYLINIFLFPFFLSFLFAHTKKNSSVLARHLSRSEIFSIQWPPGAMRYKCSQPSARETKNLFFFVFTTLHGRVRIAGETVPSKHFVTKQAGRPW